MLGWPKVSDTVRGEVTVVAPLDEATLVTSVGRGGGRVVAWEWVIEDSSWEVGERVDVAVDEDGEVHRDQQLGFAGVPFLLFGIMVVPFIGFALRRLFGLMVALGDVRHGADRPRLGYAAFITDPAPKTWRPLVAIWWSDPTAGERLAVPDAVYRADDETGEDLFSSSSLSVDVMQAWIDTGRFRFTKPRWVGVDAGVVVPHRRALFGRWYAWMVTRRASFGEPEPLGHRPPEPGVTAIGQKGGDEKVHRMAPMVAWRLLGLLAFFVLAGIIDGDSVSGRALSPPDELSSTAFRRVAQRRGHAESTTVPEPIAPLGMHHDFVAGRRVVWSTEAGTDVDLQEWVFASEADARAVADAELAEWALAGDAEGVVVTAPLEGGGVGTVRVFVAGDRVVRVLVAADRERPDVMDRVVGRLAGLP